MKKIKVLLIFILFLIVALTATLPAAFVIKHLKIEQTVKMGNIQGPWWRFKVDWISYKNIIRQDVKLSLDAQCLLTLDICVKEKDDQTELILRYHLLEKTAQIENSRIAFKLNELDAWTKSLLVKPSGSINIKIDRAKSDMSRLTDLNAELLWYSVGVQGETFDLGTLIANMDLQSDKLVIELSDNSNVLDITGTVVLLKSGLVDTNIELKVLPGFPAEVDSLISSVMKKRGRFVYELNSKQKLNMIKSIGLF